jgi:hypothetical protein
VCRSSCGDVCHSSLNASGEQRTSPRERSGSAERVVQIRRGTAATSVAAHTG